MYYRSLKKKALELCSKPEEGYKIDTENVYFEMSISISSLKMSKIGTGRWTMIEAPINKAKTFASTLQTARQHRRDQP